MNRRSVFAAGAAAASVLPFVSLAYAQTAAPAPEDPAKQPALLGGNYATLTSQIALQKASSDAVRTFAELEIAEQAATAEAFGATPGPMVSQRHADLIEQLQAAPAGPDFDMMYVDGQIAGHEELRAIHATYAADGTDPMARGASMVGVPSIDSHLAMLRMIRGTLG